MRSFNWICVSVLLFAILNSSGVSAGLTYWPSQSYYYSNYQSIKVAKSNVDILDCGDKTFVFQLEEVKITPDIVTPGGEVTIEVSGTLSRTVEEGAYADVNVKLGRVRLLHKKFDICEELRKDNNELQCPFEEGKFTMKQTVQLPKEIPRAKFLVEAFAFTVDDDDLACVHITANFMTRRRGFSNKWARLSQY